MKTLRIVRKSKRELEKMRAAGAVVGLCHERIREMAKPGVTTQELDDACRELILEHGGEPAFYQYRGFPANICVSINEVVVHGIPSERELQEGDILSADVGVCLDGFYGDAALTVPIGEVSEKARGLIDAAYGSLWAAIRQCRPGNRLKSISRTVQKYAESRGYTVVRQFVGHGIGKKMHEDPQVPNYVSKLERVPNPRLESGLCLAIEPMLNIGTHKVVVDAEDNWTVRTADGELSAHVEHTVAVTKDGFRVMTLPPGEEITNESEIPS